MRPHCTIILVIALLAGCLTAQGQSTAATKPVSRAGTVDTTSLRGKVMCGYQGWFRCPDDPAKMGWIHWSRDSRRIAPDLLTFEMWPDMADYSATERYPAPGFTYPGGRQAELFSSDSAPTVLRHFEWMRDYGIDGAWLQHFLVDLPGGPQPTRYPSRLRVLNHVRAAALKTGRVWAISYDIADMPVERIFDVLTSDWKKMVDEKVVEDPRYLHQGGHPAVQIWGFYFGNEHNPMNAELANRLIDRLGMLWIPVVYPGFSWDNLQRQSPGASLISRRGGRFLWEQFFELSRLGVDTVYVAMFDEVDEGTAIFKVTSSPPTQGHFVGYDGLPSDWYLRLVGEAARRLHDQQPVPREIPVQP